MISYSKTFRIAALLCAITTTGLAVGQDGVVRMSDRSGNATGPNSAVAAGTGQVFMSRQGQGIQQVRHETVNCGDPCMMEGPNCVMPQWACDSNGAACGSCGPNSYCGGSGGGCNCGCNCNCNSNCGCNCNSGCNAGGNVGCMCCNGCNGNVCNGNVCYAPMDCNSVFSSGYGRERCRNGRCNGNGNGGYCQNDTTICAHSMDSGTGSGCRDYWHGQSMSFRNKNARLADHLFGWMIPSGCCGSGCPPCGKYHITYADQPDYINQNDTQLYAAQGYGMPITVPLAPNVNYSYNYSAGLPSSRLTQIGNYNPQTSPQPLYHQTW